MAEQGDVGAQNNLGLMYDTGEGVPRYSVTPASLDPVYQVLLRSRCEHDSFRRHSIDFWYSLNDLW
ncbi:MAG: hypothetical protein GTO41_28765 [Burkholderiales bacterium]|nr:hypothetical protein [Burkholderiales bacterium]